MADELHDHNVFILGAGFSKEAGAPLLHDFLDKAREFYDDPDSPLDTEERKQFERVFKFKREVAKAREKFRIDLDNVEQLFGLVEMSQRLSAEPAATREATVYLIAKTLELALRNRQRPQVGMGINQGYGAQVEPAIRYLRRQASGGDFFETDIYTHFALMLSGKYDDQRKRSHRSSTVITFNYDLVVDDGLMSVGAMPDYALKDAVLEADYQGTRVPLLKLHGSTNWAICECNQIHILGQKATGDAAGFRSMRCTSCGKSGLRLLLVPPSWDKSEYSKIMQPVWRRAVDALKTATRICVIGYSMPETDAFFKFLLALGLAENDHLYKLIVVDWLAQTPLPGERTIETRWKEVLEGIFVGRRFAFLGRGFGDFIRASIQPLLNRAELIR
jgi:hypothetical protein